jgi:membrane-bound lytic murein transglycosylase A
MIKKTHILNILLSVIILTASLLVIINVLKKPVEWTKENSLRRVSSPGIDDAGKIQSLLLSLEFSLKYLYSIPPETPVSFGKQVYRVEDVTESIRDFRDKLKEKGLSKDFFDYVGKNYRFFRSSAKSVLFTGYYEARLKGSLTRSETYRYPLYKKPDSLLRIDLSQFPFYKDAQSKIKNLPGILRGRIDENKTIVPYYSRDEIDYRQKLTDEKLEIAWIDDAIDIFFLQIQGSGVVELDTGEHLRVNYADSNGHPYRPIGRLLIERGVLTRDNVSMQSIRKYLKEHPEEMKSIFNYNPSYVFFRVVDQGPLGFIRVPITPYRSIALDHRLFPKGALCYIETELPTFDERGKLKKWEKHRGFVLNQDTGGAIRSPARADLFTGMGEESELVAGHLKRKGTFYFLLKK